MTAVATLISPTARRLIPSLWPTSVSAVSAFGVSATPGRANTALADRYNPSWFHATPGIALIMNSENLATKPEATTEERLAAKNADFRLLVSQVTVYLRPEVASNLYRQIDLLLDPDAWDESAKLPSADSFADLRGFLAGNPRVDCPGLGLSDAGHIIAVWRENNRQVLTVRFLAAKRVQWTFVSRGNEENPSWGRAGHGPTALLMDSLRQNGIEGLLSS